MKFADYGLNELTADGIHKLRHRLEKDDKLALNYLL